MSSFLQQQVDFDKHNEQLKELLDPDTRPYRAACSIVGSITNYLLNPELNTRGWTFRDFFESVDIQIAAELEFQKWQRFNVICDREMGLPSDGWRMNINFQNCYDATWFGCPLHYHVGQVPDTVEILADEKTRLYDLPDPDPLSSGLMGRALEFYEQMEDKCAGMEFEGRPVIPPDGLAGEGTDGPLDCAYKLRGAGNLLTDMLTDEDYYHDLMGYITRNIIRRIKAAKEFRWSRRPNSPDKGNYKSMGGFADDAVALLSSQHYQEFVLPYHKMIFDEFASPGGVWVHLCGDATRHFKFIVDNLNAIAFDTGFPVDFGWLRKELGPDIHINGGPTVMLLKDGTPDAIDAEVRRIANSGVLEGGKFTFIAANNLAPRTPVENIAAFYESVKRWGVFDK